MSLGSGALKVGREPERLRHSKEVSMATLRAGTTQNTELSRTGGGQGTSKLPQQHIKNYFASFYPEVFLLFLKKVEEHAFSLNNGLTTCYL